MEYSGPVELKSIENIAASDKSNFILLKENQVKIVHYPDCQQLIVWLSHPGSEYSRIRWFDENKTIIEEYPVSEKLNGSIQLIWDTLPYAPGNYSIEIDWKEGCKHVLHLHKQIENLPVEEKITVDESLVASTSSDLKVSNTEYKVYKDGFGQDISNEDLILRDKVINDLANQFSRRLEFRGNFRSGYITYIEGETKIDFLHEMGGGGCAFYIEIPTVENWERETGLPLSKRDPVIQFMAEQINAKENKNFSFKILDTSINFYKA